MDHRVPLEWSEGVKIAFVLYLKRSFCQDRLGTNIGKQVEKRSTCFVQDPWPMLSTSCASSAPPLLTPTPTVAEEEVMAATAVVVVVVGRQSLRTARAAR